MRFRVRWKIILVVNMVSSRPHLIPLALITFQPKRKVGGASKGGTAPGHSYNDKPRIETCLFTDKESLIGVLENI